MRLRPLPVMVSWPTFFFRFMSLTHQIYQSFTSSSMESQVTSRHCLSSRFPSLKTFEDQLHQTCVSSGLSNSIQWHIVVSNFPDRIPVSAWLLQANFSMNCLRIIWGHQTTTTCNHLHLQQQPPPARVARPQRGKAGALPACCAPRRD